MPFTTVPKQTSLHTTDADTEVGGWGTGVFIVPFKVLSRKKIVTGDIFNQLYQSGWRETGYESRRTSKDELFVFVYGMSRDREGAQHIKIASSE